MIENKTSLKDAVSMPVEMSVSGGDTSIHVRSTHRLRPRSALPPIATELMRRNELPLCADFVAKAVDGSHEQ
jgi:hypothetical protein